MPKVVAETITKGKTCRTLSKLSEKFGVYIIVGSIIERDGVKSMQYNKRFGAKVTI